MKAEYRKIATQEQIEAHFRLHGGQWSGGLRISIIEGTRALLKARAFMKKAKTAPVPPENLSWRDLRNPTRIK